MLKVHSIETFGTHDGPGIRLIIFLQGCNFKCLYCHNPDTQSLKNNKAIEMPTDEILEKLEKQKPYFKDKGGLTVSGGEPTLQAEELLKVFKRVKAKGFHIALDTNGGVYNETINKLYDLTDLIMLDVKHIDPEWHKKITGVANENVLKNAAYREKSKKPMWLRYVLVPGWSDQKEYLEQWAEHFKNYKYIEQVEILPYHTLGVHKYKELGLRYQLNNVEPPNEEEIKKAEKIFKQYFDKVVVR